MSLLKRFSSLQWKLAASYVVVTLLTLLVLEGIVIIAADEVPVERGLLVTEVVPGSPVAVAGIRGGNQVARIGRYRVPLGGDIITAIKGEPVADLRELTVYLETETQIGDTVEVITIRDGEEQSVQVVLAERPQ